MRLVSRRKLAKYAAEQILAGNDAVLEEMSLRESIDPTLIGGFKLQTPTATLDATVSKKLNDLRAKKI